FPPFDGTADTLVRSIVTYLVESTDTPDDTPERLERTLGMALHASAAPGRPPRYSGSVRLQPQWRGVVTFTPSNSPDPALTLQFDDAAEDESVAESPAFQLVDLESVTAAFENDGFSCTPRYGLHGTFGGAFAHRGALVVALTARPSADTAPLRRFVTHVSATWGLEHD
ncbi:hypothetical protein, partial [Pseudoclavibacter chungangensis]